MTGRYGIDPYGRFSLSRHCEESYGYRDDRVESAPRPGGSLGSLSSDAT